MAEQLSTRNFGLIIAYLVPGFTAVWSAAFHFETVAGWLGTQDGPQVGGLLLITLASVAAGMILSALRWAVVDTLHHVTGIRGGRFDDSMLTERLSSYVWIVENHYRYHQFYGQMLLALVFAHVMWRTSGVAPSGIAIDLCLVGVDLVLFAGSRNALQRYYRRTESLLHTRESEVASDKRRTALRVRRREAEGPGTGPEGGTPAGSGGAETGTDG